MAGHQTVPVTACSSHPQKQSEKQLKAHYSQNSIRWGGVELQDISWKEFHNTLYYLMSHSFYHMTTAQWDNDQYQSESWNIQETALQVFSQYNTLGTRVLCVRTSTAHCLYALMVDCCKLNTTYFKKHMQWIRDLLHTRVREKCKEELTALLPRGGPYTPFLLLSSLDMIMFCVWLALVWAEKLIMFGLYTSLSSLFNKKSWRNQQLLLEII